MTVPMIPTTINGRWELLLPEHRAARPEWVAWEVERLASMHDRLEPGMVLYDVGTEEGDLSALFAQWVAPRQVGYPHPVTGEHTPYDGQPIGSDRGGVVLIEPNARVWPNVKAIFEANGLPLPLGCWEGFAAAASVPGEDGRLGPVIVDGWPECADGPMIGDHGFLQLGERPDVAQMTLDDVVTLVGRLPDAITMDVEGAEWEVLNGAEATLKVRRPLVWMSVHPEFQYHHYGTHEGDMHRWMRDRGYVGTHLGYDHEHHWLYEPEEAR